MANSTEVNIGFMSGARSSSRVLQPPGGGQSNIFAPPEQKSAQPRAKYDQQNSSNLNFCMGTTDPNIKVENCKAAPVEEVAKPAPKPAENFMTPVDESKKAQPAAGARVPPGGFSNGFW